jgi:hypothetical protein
MKIAAIICFCAALIWELYGVWGLLRPLGQRGRSC